jgi:hypothetical protein
MSTPVTQAAFEAFQFVLLSQLSDLDHHVQALESTDTRFYEVAARIEDLDQRMRRLEKELVALRAALQKQAD